MEKLTTFLNTTSVTIKTLGWIVTIIVGVAFFWFRSDDHLTDVNIHVTAEGKKEVQHLKDRIEVLEWELRQQKERCTKRHTRQEILLRKQLELYI